MTFWCFYQQFLFYFYPYTLYIYVFVCKRKTLDYSFPGFLSLEAVVMLTAKVNLGRLVYVANVQDSVALFLNVVLS